MLLAGDMNAHTKEEDEIEIVNERQRNEGDMYFVDDFVQPLNDIYSFTNDDFKFYDISPVRKNEDKSVNMYGRS